MDSVIQIHRSPSKVEYSNKCTMSLNMPHLRRLSKALHSIGSFDEPGPIFESLGSESTPENSPLKDFDFFKQNTQNKMSITYAEDDLFFTQIIDAKSKTESAVEISTKEDSQKKVKLVKKKSFTMAHLNRISNVLTKSL